MKKRLAFFIIVLVFVFLFVSCLGTDKVVRSLGRSNYAQIHSCNIGFDSIGYEKYRFQSPNIDKNEYLAPLENDNMEKLLSLVETFEGYIDSMETGPVAENYDFDLNIIDATDYAYITTEHTNDSLTGFSAYFFDVESKTLFHLYNHN